jgi:hypothetical protein
VSDFSAGDYVKIYKKVKIVYISPKVLVRNDMVRTQLLVPSVLYFAANL